MIPFNKVSNSLRRSDEADPSSTLLSSQDVVHGGFSAQMARNSRGAKSRRKAGLRARASRHFRLG